MQIATYVMLIGQPFALAAGCALVWTRLFYAERVAKRFKDAKAAGVLRVRHRFRDAHEVEICARLVLLADSAQNHFAKLKDPRTALHSVY